MPNKKEIKKKYSFSISKYGGEVAMGIITSEQYDYWNGRSDEELKDYVMGWQINEYEKEHNIPLKAFNGILCSFSYSFICHPMT
tara:strand:- start:198 stop:449 length:252 start_codon:yes stop_codon:yes gene_type:complete